VKEAAKVQDSVANPVNAAALSWTLEGSGDQHLGGAKKVA
jgi:hypothetical protein